MEFGDGVADIVTAYTDGTDGTAESKSDARTDEEKRANWRSRKLACLAHLARATDGTLLVSACDKLHNARAVVGDLENPAVGFSAFDRFTGGVDGSRSRRTVSGGMCCCGLVRSCSPCGFPRREPAHHWRAFRSMSSAIARFSYQPLRVSKAGLRSPSSSSSPFRFQ